MTLLKKKTLSPHPFFEDVGQLDIRPPFHQKPKPLGGLPRVPPPHLLFFVAISRDVSIVDLASQWSGVMFFQSRSVWKVYMKDGNISCSTSCKARRQRTNHDGRIFWGVYPVEVAADQETF